MQHKQQTLRFRLDRYSQTCLTAIAILLTVLVLGLWADRTPSAAEAQDSQPLRFGDSGGQRVEIQDAIQESNRKMDQLIQLFQDGEAKVQIVNEADENEDE